METIARLAVLLSIATGFLAGMVAAPTNARAPTTIGGLVILLWPGGALALVSWLLAIGPRWWRSRAARAWTRIAEAHAR